MRGRGSGGDLNDEGMDTNLCSVVVCKGKIKLYFNIISLTEIITSYL